MGEGVVKCAQVKCNTPIVRGSHHGLVVSIPMFMKMPNLYEDVTTRLHFQRVVEVPPCHLSPATPFIHAIRLPAKKKAI